MNYNSHSERVHSGTGIEQIVCELFRLTGQKKTDGDQPDILDHSKHIVGEVKSSENGARVIIKIDQFNRYSSLVDKLERNTMLDDTERQRWGLYYFFVGYDKIAVTDIYVVSQRAMKNIIDRKEHKRTIWYIRDYSAIRYLRDPKQQVLDNTKKKRAIKAIIEKNVEGTWVRIGESDLRKACRYKRATPDGVVLHYTRKSKALERRRQT